MDLILSHVPTDLLNPSRKFLIVKLISLATLTISIACAAMYLTINVFDLVTDYSDQIELGFKLGCLTFIIMISIGLAMNAESRIAMTICSFSLIVAYLIQTVCFFNALDASLLDILLNMTTSLIANSTVVLVFFLNDHHQNSIV